MSADDFKAEISPDEVADADERAFHEWYARNHGWHARQIANSEARASVAHRAEHESAFMAGCRHVRGAMAAV